MTGSDFNSPESLRGYAGSKGSDHVYPIILSRLALSEMLLVPFAGSGQIARRSRASSIYLNDLDDQVCKAWREMPDLPEGIDVFNEDWREFLECARNSDTIYMDPPYLYETRSRKYYQHEMGEILEHSLLLNFVKRAPCSIAISHPPHWLYEETLSHWHKIDIEFLIGHCQN